MSCLRIYTKEGVKFLDNNVKPVCTFLSVKQFKFDIYTFISALKTMLSPLLDQSSLFDFGFKVIRKRRATVQDVKSLSPTRKTPRRRSSGFLRPTKAPIDDPMSENDFVLQVIWTSVYNKENIKLLRRITSYQNQKK